MKLVKLPSGKILNLDQVLAFSPGVLAVTVFTPVSQFDVQHEDAKALRHYLDENSDLTSATPRAESLAEVIGGGH
ncbi:MAG TPA: hypothetical protein VFF76_07290 [Holophagaceae bacterium]|jgi:hypothetical protein|nr:hypothetical protein [Holophagaceae bacterium]